ncbi:MAG: glutamate--tRNA ligase [Nitrospirota bacterium]|jgi:glutamyl-tRNA synthetase
MNQVRVRFAPSPTGHLHIGGARTALFNWLYARSSQGSFILRIEDTDRSRSTEEYIESILEGMRWLGLHWDEGPFRQTERMDIYRQAVDRLLEENKAYHCYCTAEELEDRRKQAVLEGRPPVYDRRCRDLGEAHPDRTPTVRFRMPEAGIVTVKDMVKGNVSFDNSQLDDLIIMRSDGTPTYNFVVVVDDVQMRITHVIRGDDHLNNTPKQLHIYRALGYDVPVFAHLPMILGPDRQRLSKRHGATSVVAYRDQGYLPDALVNYLARLGWSHGDQEVFSRQELVKLFGFENVGASAAVFNAEKLLWLNAQHVMATPVQELARLVRPFLTKDGTISEDAELDPRWLARAIETLRERAKTLVELARSLRYYILEDVEVETKAAEKFLTEKTLPVLKEIRTALQGVEPFAHEGLERAFKGVMLSRDVKMGAVAQPVRVAVTGRTESPGIYEVLEVVGKEKALRRLDKAVSRIEKP